MIERLGICEGADITLAAGGSPNTRVECDSVRGKYHLLSEVNSEGAVVQDEKHQFQRVELYDLGSKGVHVFYTTRNNFDIKPGEGAHIAVGSQSVKVNGTAEAEVTFNGQTPTKCTDEVSETRYPFRAN